MKYVDCRHDTFQAKSQGFILVTTMLFLVVLNLLIISSLEVVLFEIRMSQNYQAKMLAFNQAQNNLYRYEYDLQQGVPNPKVRVIPNSACGFVFYQVAAVGVFGKAKSELQSTYMVKVDDSHCPEKLNLIPGRQSWREL